MIWCCCYCCSCLCILMQQFVHFLCCYYQIWHASPFHSLWAELNENCACARLSFTYIPNWATMTYAFWLPCKCFEYYILMFNQNAPTTQTINPEHRSLATRYKHTHQPNEQKKMDPIKPLKSVFNNFNSIMTIYWKFISIDFDY